jgi:LCP family protein required for cell wall assembly
VNILAFVGAGLAVVLVATGSVVGIAAYQLASDLGGGITINESEAPIPEIGAFEGGFNMLVVGNDAYYDRDSVLNDVNILIHVSEDQTSAIAVSIPRDMVVPFPPCTDEATGKTSSAARGLPINNALSYGGLACVVDVVRGFTGLDIQFAGMIGFDGVAAMADAVGGVPVCIQSPIDDDFTGLHLPAGTSTLTGWDALMFLRTRHGVGDGSDLTRISSQQVYLSALLRKLKSEETLTDFGKLWGLAQIAGEKMTLSAELTQPTTMIAMAKALDNIPMDRITLVQYPGGTGGTGIYLNHVQPNEARGAQLMDAIRNDQAIGVAEAGDGRGSELDPNATPVPVETPTTDPSATPGSTPEPAVTVPEQVVFDWLRGQSAADQTCTIGN